MLSRRILQNTSAADTFNEVPIRPLSSKAGPKTAQAAQSTTTAARTASQRKSLWSAREVLAALDSISKVHEQMEPLPPVWSSQASVADEETAQLRRNVYQDTRYLLNQIEALVKQGTLSPSGKHGKILSHQMEQVLSVFSESLPADESANPQKEAFRVLDLLRSWNLDYIPRHYEYAILAAARQQQWKEASSLFWQQINPDSCSSPMQEGIATGLYAIARDAQETSPETVAEQVFDAVLSMSMVSPLDQEKYVLAAGLALGRAGEWKASIDYLENSFNANQLGEPLIAAVMNACIVNARNIEALQLFDDRLGKNLALQRKWHWGGGEGRLSPFCRDLAMRAMGETPGNSQRAVEFFHIVEETNVSVSLTALLGVLRSCECDGNWIDAVELLQTILQRSRKVQWTLSNDQATDLPEWSSLKQANGRFYQLEDQVWDMIVTVMRTCNSSGKQGMALYCLRLAELELARAGCLIWEVPTEIRGNPDMELLTPQRRNIVQSLVPLVVGAESPDEILSASIIALCGLGCHRSAMALFEAATPLVDNAWVTARECYQYGLFHMKLSEENLEFPWESAHRHIHRLTGALASIESEKQDLSGSQQTTILLALAQAMRCCNAAGQPDTGLYLADWVKSKLEAFRPNPGAAVSSAAWDLVGFGSEPQTTANTDLKDSLLAETIDAYRLSKNNEAGLRLFSSSIDPKSDLLTGWKLSCNAAISLLAQAGKSGEAIELFGMLGKEALTPETLCRLSKIYGKERRWDAIVDLYLEGKSLGLSADEFCIAVMKAASQLGEDDLKTQMVVMRGIVSDIAEISGINSKAWLESRYFQLSRELPNLYICLLMQWKDPNTWQLDELELILKIFDGRKFSGLKAKNSIVRRIVGQAAEFREGCIPDDKERFPRVPIDREGWLNLLLYVLDEIQGSAILDDSRFISTAARAFHTLKADDRGYYFLQDAVARRTLIPWEVLDNASLELEKEEETPILRDIQLLLLQRDEQ